jgi:DNA replication protein DnaC
VADCDLDPLDADEQEVFAPPVPPVPFFQSIRAQLQAAAGPQRPARPLQDPAITEAHEEALEYDQHRTKLAEDWGADADALMKAEPLERARILGRDRFEGSIHELAERAGVPTRTCRVLAAKEPLSETPALVAAREFVSEHRNFLLLLGGVGTGKSLAACWTLLSQRRQKTRDPVTGQDLPVPGEIDFGLIKFTRASEIARLSVFDDRDTWDDLRTVHFLVVDDLGVEAETPLWTERVGELVDVRYGEELPTVITSNLDAAAFRARYGARIASRVNSDGIVANCGAGDRRAAGKAQP